VLLPQQFKRLENTAYTENSQHVGKYIYTVEVGLKITGKELGAVPTSSKHYRIYFPADAADLKDTQISLIEM